jgi:UDP-glucose 4-epimerase
MAELLTGVLGRPALRPEFRGERLVNPVSRRLAGTRKARGLLGFSSTIGLEAGLRDLVGWWRAQRSANRSRPGGAAELAGAMT